MHARGPSVNACANLTAHWVALSDPISEFRRLVALSAKKHARNLRCAHGTKWHRENVEEAQPRT
eukprot:COSAG01_NODE_1219_length_11174_cov_9.438555_8_plen_64_part_00